jgi:ATP-dependent exoDNAse (exonuclease V) alpha subunit
MLQKTALDILKTGRNVYLTGAAGSGKTHVLNEYITYLKNRNVGVGVTASTGIAATHIGGVTIHSWSGVGIKDYLSEIEMEGLEQKEYLWKRFNKTKVLIIDEVSMISPRMFDTVEKICRRMKRCEEPFGGMQVILSGDFFQLPPIAKGSDSVEFVNKSDAWNSMNIRVCYLEEQFRTDDFTLTGILSNMRSGVIAPAIKDKINSIGVKKFDNGVTPTKLYTHNVNVDEINNKELDTLPGKAEVFEMSTKGRNNLVENLKKSVLAPYALKLKKDAVVMFVKNSKEEGFVNGTLGVVEDFDMGIPVVRTFSGEKIFVSTSRWSIEEDGRTLASVEQLPLRHAWAITVHKSQGMSLDAAEIDLSKSFVPGQGYVALSRLRTLEGLSLLGINDMALSVHPEVSRLDKHLLADSLRWEKAIDRFSDEKIKKMHDEFVLKSDGTIDEDEIEKNMSVSIKDIDKKVLTHEKTLALIKEGLSLEEIAKKRGQVLGTIISHLEKIKESGNVEDIDRFKPKSLDLNKIKEAFKKINDVKLAPVHKKLKGKYTYEQIRLARLFI